MNKYRESGTWSVLYVVKDKIEKIIIIWNIFLKNWILLAGRVWFKYGDKKLETGSEGNVWKEIK